MDRVGLGVGWGGRRGCEQLHDGGHSRRCRRGIYIYEWGQWPRAHLPYPVPHASNHYGRLSHCARSGAGCDSRARVAAPRGSWSSVGSGRQAKTPRRRRSDDECGPVLVVTPQHSGSERAHRYQWGRPGKPCQPDGRL